MTNILTHFECDCIAWSSALPNILYNLLDNLLLLELQRIITLDSSASYPSLFISKYKSISSLFYETSRLGHILLLSYSNHNSAINLDNKVKLHFIQFTEVAHKNSDFHKYLTTNAKCGECNNVNESLAFVYSHKL